jgi:rubrerythrin
MVAKGSKTEHNLLATFAGESQARNRYTMYAAKARDEGFFQIEAIFLETAEHEKVHAKRFFRFLPGNPVQISATYPTAIGDTVFNLQASAAGEKEEHSILYTEAAKVADEEGYPEVAKQFREVAKVEVEHEKRYLKLLQNIKDGRVFKRETKVLWKCSKCGRIIEATQAPLRCPTCDHPQGHFELFVEAY